MDDAHDHNADAAPLPLGWTVDIRDIPAKGYEVAKAATDAERLDIAAALGLLSCERLSASGRIRPIAGDGFRLQGRLQADVVQACVVTLAPVHDTIDVPLSVEFVPVEQAKAAAGGAVELDDPVETEPIEGDALALGRVLFEELAAAINPYPRRPGAEYAAPAADAATAAANTPFAVLARLKAQKTEP